ncbi:MAG: glutamine--fructose-6-phosphate transaminase (isomerizing) [Chloroflexi bacterium]|nr:glutamine--fructose-6-phosphate transaminase (isomerizing) [Chloroflexota bacterium]
MCGIIGYLGERQAAPVLLEGLARLEYRGYDSAGVAVVDGEGEVTVRRAPGKLRRLEEQMRGALPRGTMGLGHTRWATHGGPTEFNAHPHTDCKGRVIVVHNGIVENYAELRAELRAKGHRFASETDTEVIPHLIEEGLAQGGDFASSFRAVASRLRGAHAIAAIWSQEPETLVSMRLGNAGGICVGHGNGEMALASDLAALLPLTTRVVFLAPGEVAVLHRDQVQYTDLEGRPLERRPRRIVYNPEAAAKGGYKHFMLKEIMEQPESATAALRGRLRFEPEALCLDEVSLSERDIRDLTRVVLVGMGTSLHAAMAGAMMMEQVARLPATAENAAEFRYRDPAVDRHTLVVSVGQSGETADTLAAMEEAIGRGARSLTVCNVEDSQATRLAEGTILMHAGMEIGVASTKTFVNSLMCLYMLAVHVGMKKGVIGEERASQHVRELARVPDVLGRVLRSGGQYEEVARRYFERGNFMYIGRGVQYPIAMEGALKLKEISYIHAEGVAAGEMKHGPIALIDEGMPVVALCPRDHLYEKMLGNVNEVKARNGVVLAVVTEGDTQVRQKADYVIEVPETPYLLSPIVTVPPLQLLAYHIAVLRGCDVDQPRNLAKSVTVE